MLDVSKGKGGSPEERPYDVSRTWRKSKCDASLRKDNVVFVLSRTSKSELIERVKAF